MSRLLRASAEEPEPPQHAVSCVLSCSVQPGLRQKTTSQLSHASRMRQGKWRGMDGAGCRRGRMKKKNQTEKRWQEEVEGSETTSTIEQNHERCSACHGQSRQRGLEGLWLKRMLGNDND